MPGLGIYYISPPLVIDKLIPVNSRVIMRPPKMSLMIEVECTSAVIINQGLSLSHTDHISQNKTVNSFLVLRPVVVLAVDFKTHS